MLPALVIMAQSKDALVPVLTLMLLNYLFFRLPLLLSEALKLFFLLFYLKDTIGSRRVDHLLLNLVVGVKFPRLPPQALHEHCSDNSTLKKDRKCSHFLNLHEIFGVETRFSNKVVPVFGILVIN